jgi:hypothetical protein
MYRSILESGEFYLAIGHETDCRASPFSPLCVPFSLSLSSQYSPVCSYACTHIWSTAEGFCGTVVNFDSCMQTCRQQEWDWAYVDCLQSAMATSTTNPLHYTTLHYTTLLLSSFQCLKTYLYQSQTLSLLPYLLL